MLDWSITQRLFRLYTDPKYSDMVAKCGERAWPVHKAIVCSRSNVIAMEFDNPSKVTLQQTDVAVTLL